MKNLKKKDRLTIIKCKKFLSKKIENKLKNYKSETDYYPFHDALVGKKYRKIGSFMHSINMALGQSIWEEFCKILGTANNKSVTRQYKIPYSLSQSTDNQIYEIYQKIVKNKINPGDNSITEKIKKFSTKEDGKDEDRVVDIFIEDKSSIHFIDLTSVKPNKKEFTILKLKLLRWLALGYSNYKNKKIYAYIAMPFNPYEPQSYKRFSGIERFDYKKDLKIGKDFWNSIAGFDVYKHLIDIYKNIGNRNRKQIVEKFENL